MARSRRQTDSIQEATQLITGIQAGEIAPCYLIGGEERYLAAAVLRALRETAIAPGMSALDHQRYEAQASGRRLDVDEIANALMTPPFLSRCRLIEIRDSGWFRPGSEGRQNVERLLQHLVPGSCLVFHESTTDGRAASLRLLRDAGGVEAIFAHPSHPAALDWAARRLADGGLRLDRRTLDSFVDRCEGDLALLEKEIEKLLLYARDLGRDRLSGEEVNRIAIRDQRGSIFDLTDLLSNGQTLAALRLLHILLEGGQPALVILMMLARHFRQLLCALEMDEKEIQQQLGLPAFVAERLRRQASHFDRRRLAALIAACAATDQAVKSGKLAERVALEILLAQTGRAASWSRRSQRGTPG
ncbi:MAG: DNA polymerase III subunit delta [Bacillota bacterium]|nr:DNA polymerase III subunit delta [Bacillota bacterium]